MKTILSNFAIILIVTFSITGCNDRSSKDLIKIGATLDFTGPNAVYGTQVKEGIDLAIEYINDSINKGKKVITIKFLDSRDVDREAISNINKFISLDKINFIIGGISSNVVNSMIPTIESNDAFLFAPASSGSILTKISKNFARNWPSDDLEAGYAAKYAIEEFCSERPIVVYVNSYYGKGLKNKFVNEFVSANKTVLDTISYEVDQADYKIIIGKIKKKNPDCIYLAGNPKEMGRFMKQLYEQGFKCNIISNTAFLQPDCLNLAKNADDGVIVPTPKPSDNKSLIKSVDLFQKLYLNKYSKTPTLVTANSFDAIMLIYESIKKNGYDAHKVALDIRNKKGFNGASGISNFTDGEIQTEITFMRITNNEPIEISK